MSLQRKCKLCLKNAKRSDAGIFCEGGNELLQYVLSKFQIELEVNEKVCGPCLNNLKVVSDVLTRWQEAQMKTQQSKKNKPMEKEAVVSKQSEDDAHAESMLKAKQPTQPVRALRSRNIKVDKEESIEKKNVKTWNNVSKKEQSDKSDCELEMSSQVEPQIKSETTLEREIVDTLESSVNKKLKQTKQPTKPLVFPRAAEVSRLEIVPVEKSVDIKNDYLVAVLSGSNGTTLAELYLDEQSDFNSDETPSAYSVCNCCSKEFSRLRDLTKHLKTQRKQYLECEECMQSFDTLELLQKHQQATIHVGVCVAGDDESKQLILYNCSQCDKIFRDYWGTLRHYREVHMASNDRFKCSECGATYKYRISLEQHLAKHLNVNMKTIKCNLCTKTFRNNYQLGVHMRSHTGEQPFLCLICNKRFSHRANLQVHQRTHTGELPFKCEKCGKAFRTTSHLRRHSPVCRNGKQRRQRSTPMDIKTESNSDGDFQYNAEMSTQAEEVYTLSTSETVPHTHLGQQSLLKANIRRTPQILNLDVVPTLNALPVSSNSSQVTVHKCNYCNKGYTQRTALIKHIRMHSNEKPLKREKLEHELPVVHTDDETIDFQILPLTAAQLSTDSDPDPDGSENHDQLNLILTEL